MIYHRYIFLYDTPSNLQSLQLETRGIARIVLKGRERKGNLRKDHSTKCPLGLFLEQNKSFYSETKLGANDNKEKQRFERQ